MKFGIEMKLVQLLENDEAIEIFDQYLPNIRKMLSNNKKAEELSIEKIVAYLNGAVPITVLKPLDEALQRLNTEENHISPSEAAMIARFKEIDFQEKEKKQSEITHSQDAIHPGQVWLDTEGKPIQAHGGAVIYEDGLYYWYGENKEYTDGMNGIWTWGIRMYSSKDLYNWNDLGLIITPNLEDPDSSIFPTKRLDRPHILKCSKTGKYVCWTKLSGEEAAFDIFEADSLMGPYQMVKERFRPQNQPVGDFDLILSKESGKAFLYYNVHSNPEAIVGMELEDDFLSTKNVLSRQYDGVKPPFTREAPCLFEANEKKYMLTSGMSGYIPNRSDLAVAKDWDNEFQSIGNPHVDDPSNASFNSQISKVFRVQGTNLHIAMADRWVPDYMMDAKKIDLFERAIASHYDPEHYQATEEELQVLEESPSLSTANTSIANYVWLPITFDETGTPQIAWHEKWKIENFIEE